MKKKWMNRGYLCVAAAVTMIFLWVYAQAVAAPAAAPKAKTEKPAATPWSPGPMPKSLIASSYDVGGGAYIVSAALGEGIFKKYGIRMRSLPVGTGTSRILNVKLGNADLGLTIDGLFAAEGEFDFSTMDWGPQSLRMIYMSNRQSAWSIAATRASGIKTLADLKGKRAGWLIGSPFNQAGIAGALAFAGLSVKDVQLVEVRSIGAQYQALNDGKIDFCPLDSTASIAYQIESSPQGLQWIPFPPEDKEGWKRFRQINPQMQSVYCKYGAGFSEQNPQWVATVPFPQYFVYANADERKVYWIVKMLAESFDEYRDISIGMPWHRVDEAVKAYSTLPYHPGAVRYFKEKGLWTPQLEKNQGELLDRQAKLQVLWKQAVNDSLQSGMKEKEFPDSWTKKKKDAFPDYWFETPPVPASGKKGKSSR